MTPTGRSATAPRRAAARTAGAVISAMVPVSRALVAISCIPHVKPKSFYLLQRPVHEWRAELRRTKVWPADRHVGTKIRGAIKSTKCLVGAQGLEPWTR